MHTMLPAPLHSADSKILPAIHHIKRVYLGEDQILSGRFRIRDLLIGRGNENIESEKENGNYWNANANNESGIENELSRYTKDLHMKKDILDMVMLRGKGRSVKGRGKLQYNGNENSERGNCGNGKEL
jgi:hypothetical protein